ncbi:MAG: hypothetical protein WBQ18_06990 [Solirubrobacteraceae bacterium]
MTTVLSTLVTVTCAGLVAACGGSGGSAATGSDAPSPAHVAAGIKFAGCMRSHGVPNFPDPTGGGGIHISSGSGIDISSPAFQAAQASCQKLLPGGGPGARRPSEQDKLHMLRISQCMRRHGVSGFPDPTLRPPANPNPADYSILENLGGVVLAVPSTIDTSSPVFRRAGAACGFH